MPDNNLKFHRRSIRLPEYDYSQEGAYYVTICTRDRKCLFGEITDGQMKLNRYGEIASNEWIKTGELRPYVIPDVFVIMPNHIHGVLVITDDDHCRGTMHRAPTGASERFGKPVAGSLPTIIRCYAAAVTRQIKNCVIVRATKYGSVIISNMSSATINHTIKSDNTSSRTPYIGRRTTKTRTARS
jgi:REP element-mobilizing transposase RayT